MELYVLSKYPESQIFTEDERWCECIPTMDLPDHPTIGLGAYMVPIDLYVRLTRKPGSPWGDNGKAAEAASKRVAMKVTNDIKSTTDRAAAQFRVMKKKTPPK